LAPSSSRISTWALTFMRSSPKALAGRLLRVRLVLPLGTETDVPDVAVRVREGSAVAGMAVLRGMATATYRAADHAAAKQWYTDLLGVPP
jgi:hypothetical protein